MGATLRGKRLGLYGPGWLNLPLATETGKLYQMVIAEVTRQGAVVVADPFAGSDFSAIAKPMGEWKYDQRGEESVAYDLENYLHRLGHAAAAHSVAELQRVTGQDLFAQSGPLAYERLQPSFLTPQTHRTSKALSKRGSTTSRRSTL